MTTKDKAFAYLQMPEFRNRSDAFMIHAVRVKFAWSHAWARDTVREFRKLEAFGPDADMFGGLWGAIHGCGKIDCECPECPACKSTSGNCGCMDRDPSLTATERNTRL